MAFFSKARSILRQTVSKHINSEISASGPSIFQMIRCMSTMNMKLFVGGLSYSTDDTSLREAFNKYGEVVEARIIVDRDTGRSRGFGFVTFSTGEDASSAIQALDGQELHGRTVRVNYANERTRTGFGGGGGYGGSGGYGGGGGYGGVGGYGGGGNYGSSGGYGGGGDSYGSGGGNYGSGYGGNNYGSGGSGGGYGGNYGSGSQSFGVAGGSGGSDNYVSGDASAGAGSSFASGHNGNTGLEYSGGGQFGSNESSNISDAAGVSSQDDPLAGNYRDDDDEPDDYANRRA